MHEESKVNQYWDKICGPKCLKHVLKFYKLEVNLLDLIKSCQWPVPQEGSSLDRVERVLNEHNIYTKVIRIDPGVRVIWDKPIIAVMETNQRLAHYVVIEPPDSEVPDRPWIWDCAGPEKTGSWSGLFSVVMLTSDIEIKSEPTLLYLVQSRLSKQSDWLCLFVLCADIGLLALCLSLRRKVGLSHEC
jgi:hypothetical protein